ncbi:CD109 antigen-like protein [Brachionus plicatilis]|uniref:CD109 antigen-like protein n=1 Tax=Brachionus plicatilis TaxID=10195 RepID=A0A3M7RKG5_BRAPC|nr:CD109 antigen-like protein [Brachionus plicatilis]
MSKNQNKAKKSFEKFLANSEEYIKNFEVKEYVLPKISLEVDINRYLIRSNPILEGQIAAKYTYGKGADGIVKINFRNNSFISSKEAVAERIFSFKMVDGKLNFSEKLVLSETRGYYDALVTFIDQYSGENVTQTVLFYIIETEYYISSDLYEFELNKNNTLNVKATWASNGKPYSIKAFESTLRQKINYSAKPDSEQKIFFKTDLNGSAKIEFQILDERITFIEILISPVDAEKQVTRIYLYKKRNHIETERPFTIDKSFLPSIEPLNINWLNQDQSVTTQSLLKFRLSRLQSDQECYIARYLVLSKLSIIEYEIFEMCDESDIQIQLDERFGPFSSLVVYFLDEHKNVTTATHQFELSQPTENYLNLSFGSEVVRPGDLVNLTMNTKDYSYISLCVIDKSLELIQETNEFTANQFGQQINQLKLNPYYQSNYFPMDDAFFPRRFPGFWQRPKAMLDLNNEGLVVLTNLESLNSTLADIYPVYQNVPMENAVFKEDMNYDVSTDKNDQIRKDFREIWIWDTYKNGDKKNFSISSVIPDTITSWVVSGFSLNQQHGLAIANKTQITTFKPFFVSMILPTSLTRGEILLLKVVVFNYFDFDLKNVSIEFLKTDDFDTVNGKPIDKNMVHLIDSIPAGQAQTVQFVISPKKIGLLKLSSRAKCDFAGDTEQKFIKVKAEGLEQSEASSTLINLNNTNHTINQKIVLPKNVVNQSESCYVQFIGDFLGTAFNNLNRLINRPYGCGEQNMLDLTPNIYALNYLYSLGSSKIANMERLIREAKENIVYGYQNELKYARKDGSFSAFGESDPSGSSWLTAFVLKSFCQANQFVNIDQNVISKAAEWIIAQQRTDGSFNEPGRVIHKEMQGGVDSNQTISAYITISLLESNLESKPILKSIKKSVKYLEKSINLVKKNSYSMSLISYALNLAKSKRASRSAKLVGKKLNKRQNGNIFIDEENESSDIEAASYWLLTNLLRNNVDESVRIARALVAKSNSLGSYSSTQNTVLALQALSQFALKYKFSEKNSVKISVSLDTEHLQDITINEANILILQQIKLPTCAGSVQIEASGYGSVLIQVVKNYNLVKVPKTRNRIFGLKQNFIDKNDRVLHVETCARSFNETGMVVIESGLFAGFEVQKKDLDGISAQSSLIKLAEQSADRTKVAFYLDQLDFDWICINWKMYRTHSVENLQPVIVKVYDYYNIDSEIDYFIAFFIEYY